MFGMGTRLTIKRHHRPTIRQHFGVMTAHVNHRLDGKNIARFDLRPLARLSIIRDLGVLMHLAADPVTNIVSHDRITVAFRQFLNCPTDVSQMLSGTTLFDCSLKTLLSDLDQILPVLSEPGPTGTVVAVSPTKPSRVTPQSIEKMSPSFSL